MRFLRVPPVINSRLAAACVLGSLTLLPAVVEGQTISAVDTREFARFDAVTRAVARAGFLQPQIVGHGSAAADDLFAVLTTKDGKGILIIASDAKRSAGGSALAAPVEIERDETPAQIGVRGLQFSVFLGTPGLFDIIVSHTPFMLETSLRFDTHHIIRRQGPGLERVCDFPGDSTSSTSKGIGSMSSTRRVTVEAITGGAQPGFVVTTADEMTQVEGAQGTPTTTSRSEATKRFVLPASGACQER